MCCFCYFCFIGTIICKHFPSFSRAGLSGRTFSENENVPHLRLAGWHYPHVSLQHLKWGYCDRGTEWCMYLTLIHANANLNSHPWLRTPVLANTVLKSHRIRVSSRGYMVFYCIDTLAYFIVSLSLDSQNAFIFLPLH